MLGFVDPTLGHTGVTATSHYIATTSALVGDAIAENPKRRLDGKEYAVAFMYDHFAIHDGPAKHGTLHRNGGGGYLQRHRYQPLSGMAV